MTTRITNREVPRLMGAKPVKLARPARETGIVTYGSDWIDNTGANAGNFEEAMNRCPPDAPLTKAALQKAIQAIRAAGIDAAWKADYKAGVAKQSSW